MSYCVNCGVKLRKSEKKCPLCNTPVINPNIKDLEYEPVYSNQLERFKRVNVRFVSFLSILVLVIISLIIFLCDFLMSRGISWSIYVVASIIYISSLAQYLIQKNIYVSHIIALVGTEFLLFVIAFLNNGLHWYLFLILPFILIVFAYVILVTILLKRKKMNLLRRIAISFLFSSIALIGIEISIDLFICGKIHLNWSLYASIPILVLGIVAILISFSKRLTDELRQRLFI